MNNPTILAKSDHIVLRDTLPSDIEPYLRWQTSGEWRYFDAPWEGVIETLGPAQQELFRQRFQEARQKPLPSPRQNVTIALADDTPIGWVTRYSTQRFPHVWYLGIDICEDDYLNKGLGTQALRLWVQYLFTESDVHKMEIHTWDINPRMARVAQKLGFIDEGIERELIQWQGKWVNRLRFGILRQEWEELAKS